MTTYAAYDAGLPCKNPSCKSHGQSHPNCRCYGDMADGGEVSPFCAEDRMHDKACEYYAGGGEVEAPVHLDPELSVASYLSHAGLHGLLDMGKKTLGTSVEKYNQHVKKGHKSFDKRVSHIFEGPSPEKVDTAKARDVIHEWVENGGPVNDLKDNLHGQNPQMFAVGGPVEKPKRALHDPDIAESYPEQNLMLQAAKGRMYNYLNSIKPQKHAPKLAFDDEPDTRPQEKSYRRAVDLAAHPLGVLDKIKHGTIEAEHVRHFKNLHPEVNNVVQRKLTEEITKAQLEGKKPGFKERQGMSLLMGTPLSGELSPQNIMAAQAVFKSQQPQQQQGQPPTKNKKNTSTLTKADDAFLTGNQARTARQQKQ